MIVTATNRVTAAPKHCWWSTWARLTTGFLLTTLVSSPVLADVWFLGIGNDGYYTDVSGLRDAYGSYARLHSPIVPLQFRTYRDHGGSTILQDINWLADNARPGDLAIFYYSGHGGQRSDYNGDERAGWAINSFDETIGRSGNWSTDDQFAAALGRIDSRIPSIALFDSCYSGGMVGGTDDLNSLVNVYVMMSSRENQDSYGGAPYSRFTGALIRGIGHSLPADANGDGGVTFAEWFGYARGNVYGQNPVYFDAGNFGSLAIVPVPEPAALVLLAAGAAGLLFWHRNRKFCISRIRNDRGGLERVRSEIGEEIRRRRQKGDRNMKTHTKIVALAFALLMTGRSTALAAQIGPGAFENPLTFDFSDLAYGTCLGTNYPNPYANLGVEFTGYIADYEGYGLHGHHLATGFANTPPEPFVVRARFLDEPALRVGGYVWPEVGSRTSFTAFDEHGAAIESFILSGAQFTGLEASVDLPIRSIEWRGLAGSGLTTFPRVDGVMVQFVPEPATLWLLVAAGGCAAVGAWFRTGRRKREQGGTARPGREPFNQG